jgi:hypothetical protein
MRKKILFFLLIISILPVFAQEGFVFDKGVEKVTVPLILINNLVFIPIKVNGVVLNFLLDTGVEEIILFSLEDNPSVSFYHSEKIMLRGLGSNEATEGLKTTNNILEIDGIKAQQQLVYVILDSSFNLSSQIGIPVNGIIGYPFFRENLVRIDYASKRLIVYKNNAANQKKINKNFDQVIISIEKNKPYINATIEIDDSKVPVKLLIDNGNSDSVWLFQNLNNEIKVPSKFFEDFLGKGFSGDIEGKRAMVTSFTLDKFNFKFPIVAFPDSSSVKSVRMVKNRAGSVGGDILKRFSVVFDYKNEKLYMKKNSRFGEAFTYNKSGIEIKSTGLQWVKEKVSLGTVSISGGITFNQNEENVSNGIKYKFDLKPIYEIVNIRKNSSAELSGLQVGDKIISINRLLAYHYSLEKLNELFKAEDEKMFYIEVERKGEVLKFTFQLHDVFK